MPRMILSAAVAIALVYAGLCAALFIFQRSLIYFPQPRSFGAGATLITFPVDGAEVIVTSRPHIGPDALLYFGGNGEDVSYNFPSFVAAFPDRAIYLMHYRGYGESTGGPSETALVADAIAFFDRIHAEHPNVLVIGRSLGSGIAIHLASVRPVARLVLVTPYDSIEEIAAGRFPYFPVRWLLRDKYESWRYAPLVTAPTLLLTADHDDSVPRASTEMLYSHFRGGVASLKVLAGTDHNSISASPGYIPSLQATP